MKPSEKQYWINFKSMPKTVKHGNISIELFKGRYIISHKEDAYAENACECLSFPESELHDLELCLHKLKGWEITESDKRD